MHFWNLTVYPFTENIPGGSTNHLISCLDDRLRDANTQEEYAQTVKDIFILTQAYLKVLNEKEMDIETEVLDESKAAVADLHESVLICLVQTLAQSGVLQSGGDAFHDIFIRYLARLKHEPPEGQIKAARTLKMFVNKMQFSQATHMKLKAIRDFHQLVEAYQGSPDNPLTEQYLELVGEHLWRLKTAKGYYQFVNEALSTEHPHIKRGLQAMVDGGQIDATNQLEAYLGQITMFAGPYAPTGWAFCAGQMLSVQQYEALFSLLGTAFGGDGVKTFALPDLRGCTPLGALMDGHDAISPSLDQEREGSTFPAGHFGGNSSTVINGNNLPSHTHSFGGELSELKPATPFRVAVVNGVGKATQPFPNSFVLANGTINPNSMVNAYAPVNKANLNFPLGGVHGSISDVTLEKGALLETTDVGSYLPVETLPPVQAISFIIALKGFFPSRT